MFSQYPLASYVIGVIIALAVVVCVARYIGGVPRFRMTLVFALGFLAGMLSMYIKLRVVRAP